MKTQVIPVAARPFDINTTAETFTYLNDVLLVDAPLNRDILCVNPVKREQPGIIVNHPDYVKQILVKNNQNYLKGPGFERVKMLLGNGIIVSDGAFWRKQRRMIQPAFSKTMISDLVGIIQAANEKQFAVWHDKASRQEVIDITQDASELAIDIIIRVLFSDDLDWMIEQTGTNPFAFLTEDLTRDVQTVLKFRALNKLILDTIYRRRKTGKRYCDFVDAFMYAVDKESSAGMSDTEMLDEIMTMIIAGHETSAATLQWIWYFLALHPEVAEKMIVNISQAGLIPSAGNTISAPEFGQLEQLGYIRQVMEEALRIYPPVWLFSRKSIADDMLGDYKLPAKSNVFISPYYLHRHPDFWSDCEAFNPERFSEAEQQKQHKFAYIPFSAGPRRCIGDYFATVEMQIHFAMMLPKFKLEYSDESPIQLDPSINLRTVNPIHMKITQR